jgi:hypothetical protein
MLVGVVKGSDGGGETVISCICFEVGVYEGFTRLRLVKLGGVRSCPLSYEVYCIMGLPVCDCNC